MEFSQDSAANPQPAGSPPTYGRGPNGVFGFNLGQFTLVLGFWVFLVKIVFGVHFSGRDEPVNGALVLVVNCVLIAQLGKLEAALNDLWRVCLGC